MKRTAKFFAIILVLTLLCGVFCACHKDDDDAQVKRSDVMNSVANTFLSGVNEKWSYNMTDAEIASFDNAGEYVVTNGWVALVCDVLNKSTIQTAKLQLLADTLASDDGKALIAQFADNADLIIPLLKEIGFTAEDMSSIVYDLIFKLAEEGENVLAKMMNDIDAVKDELVASQNSSVAKIDNLNENRASTERVLNVIKMTSSDRNDILNALIDAKDAFKQLVEFVYDTSVGSITDELYDKLIGENGALGNITEDEVGTLVRAMLANVKELSNALGQEDIAKLNNALDLVITHFDNKQITSSLYAQIVVYAKYAYMAVDIIPSICDVVLAGSDVLADMDFIKDFLKVAKQVDEQELNERTTSANMIILIARAIEGIMQSEDFGYEEIIALVNKMSVSGQDAYQKAMPLILVDLLLNISTFIDESSEDSLTAVHPDIVAEDDFATMVGALLLSANLDQFKEAYYTYTSTGDSDSYTRMSNLSSLCAFDYFAGESNPYNQSTQTKAWYSWYINTALPKANNKISSCVDTVRDDFKAFVDDYFKDNSTAKSAIHTIANMNVIESNISEDELNDNYMSLFVDSRLLGFVYIFELIA